MKTSTLNSQSCTKELEQVTLQLNDVDKVLSDCGRNLAYLGKVVKPNLKKKIQLLIEKIQPTLDLIDDEDKGA